MTKKEKYAIGVDLGGTSIKLGIVSEKGKILKKTTVETKAEEGPESVISQIKYGIKILIHNNKYKRCLCKTLASNEIYPSTQLIINFSWDEFNYSC